MKAFLFLLLLVSTTVVGRGQSGSEPTDSTYSEIYLSTTSDKSSTQKEPLLGLTLHGGFTTYELDTEVSQDSRLGVRFVQLTLHPSQKLYLWGQYDDGLSLDNPGLADRSINSPAYYAGGFLNYGTVHTTRLEVGLRNLPDSVNQTLIRGEQVYTTANGTALKAGGWLGFRSDDRLEWIFHTGVNFPFKERIRVEPAFFYSRTGLPEEYQWRAFLGGEYQTDQQLLLSAGLALGELFVYREQQKRGIIDGFVSGTLPITSQLKAHAIARHETVANSVTITSLVLGFTINSGSL
ncbi:MAG: hypothetical protein AB7H80_02345 [Candidatus Kapaibacterium sp.]